MRNEEYGSQRELALKCTAIFSHHSNIPAAVGLYHGPSRWRPSRMEVPVPLLCCPVFLVLAAEVHRAAADGKLGRLF